MEKKVLYTEKVPQPIGPYSQAVEYGNLLFTSGQIAIDPATGNLYTGDIQQETRLVMENLKALLEAAGLGFGHIIKSSIFLSDMGNFPLVNEVYAAYFDSEPPARETVEVAGLPKGVNVEISVIAGR